MNIFILEDDLSLQKGISLKLKKEGHDIHCSFDITSAKKYINHQFDFAIIDINLPDGNGLEICKELRETWSSTHILILTANDAETDIVMGYELGADDYMTKPFSLSVLLSKINVVKRHLEGNHNITPLSFDPAKQTIIVNNKLVLLTRNETRLLNAFLHNIGQILTKEQLIQTLWDIDSDFVDDNTLAVNIQRLRGKIEDDHKKPKLIENIRGVGYRFNKIYD